MTLGLSVMVANCFLRIGEARRATLPSISRTYLFAAPPNFILVAPFGERRLWLAQPTADGVLTAVTLAVVLRSGLAGALRPSWARIARAA